MQSGAGQLRHLLLAALLVLNAAGVALAEPALREVANLNWRGDAPWFGGFSAIEVTGDGARAVLLTDRGSLVRVALERRDGRLTGARLLGRRPLRHRNGEPLRGSERDAEGLAIARDGQAYASYEFRDHVAALNLETARNRLLHRHPDFAGFPHNSGLEALAIHPDGTLYALSENPPDASGTIPLYRYRNGSWRVSHWLPGSLGHLPVGADFDDAGRLFVLERQVSPLGFSSRIRLVRLTPQGGQTQTLLTTPPGAFGNLEGISAWRDAGGIVHLTLVADDNFLPIQRSQIVEFRLTE